MLAEENQFATLPIPQSCQVFRSTPSWEAASPVDQPCCDALGAVVGLEGGGLRKGVVVEKPEMAGIDPIGGL